MGRASVAFAATAEEVEGPAVNEPFSASKCHSVHPRSDARYVWYVILLLATVNMVNLVDRMALAILAPLIKRDLDLTDAQLGALTGFAFALFYAACGVPIGRWADRGIRRNIVALALTTWSAMTMLSGAAQNFWHLFLARVGVGAGEAGAFSPGASIICDYVPPERRSRALAFHAFGMHAGVLAGMVCAGWLGDAVGWRLAFIVLGLPGVVLAIIVRWTLLEPARGILEPVVQDKVALSFSKTLTVLWRCDTYRLLTMYLVANGFVNLGLSQWWPSYYARLFAVDLSSIGLYLGVALGGGASIGVLVGGFVATKAALRNVRLPLTFGAALTVLAIPSAFGSLLVSSLAASLFLVALTGFFLAGAHGPVLAAQYNVVKAHMRATAGATAALFTSVLGFGLGPFCVGVLSDVLAPSLGVESVRYALIAPICAIPFMVVAILAATKVLSRDLEMVRAHNKEDSVAAVRTGFAAEESQS